MRALEQDRQLTAGSVVASAPMRFFASEIGIYRASHCEAGTCSPPALMLTAYTVERHRKLRRSRSPAKLLSDVG